MCEVFAQVELVEGVTVFRVRLSWRRRSEPSRGHIVEEGVLLTGRLVVPAVCWIELATDPKSPVPAIVATSIGWHGRLEKRDLEKILGAICDQVSGKYACKFEKREHARLITTVYNTQMRLLDAVAANQEGVTSSPLLSPRHKGDRGRLFVFTRVSELDSALQVRLMEEKPNWFFAPTTGVKVFGHGRSPVEQLECSAAPRES